MLSFVARRLAVSLVLVWLVASLVFMVIHLVPGDPAELLLSMGGAATGPQWGRDLREKLGLALSLWS